MKIIIIGPAHPYRGGIADTNESFCQTLIEEGHNASIVTFSMQYPEFLFPGKSQYSQEDAPVGIKITRLINSINPINWKFAANKINRSKPDLVIVRYWLPFLGPCLGSVARFLNKNIITLAMCDNVIPHEKRIGDKAFTSYFLNSFDGFITLSSTTYEELNQFSTKPKRYFPHPINKNLGTKLPQAEARHHLGLDANGKYLLFFGLVRKYKGLDLTLKALAEESLKGLDVRLLIVGEFYEDQEKYKALIRKFNLEGQVTIIDQFVPTSDIKYYFSAADMVIQTYHSASQSGISQIAFNFDCPILVTNVGGLTEIIPHQKVGYVSNKDPQEIAGYISDFYQNNRRLNFSEAVQIEKLKYTWNKFSEEVLALYQQLKNNKIT